MMSVVLLGPAPPRGKGALRWPRVEAMGASPWLAKVRICHMLRLGNSEAWEQLKSWQRVEAVGASPQSAVKVIRNMLLLGNSGKSVSYVLRRQTCAR